MKFGENPYGCAALARRAQAAGLEGPESESGSSWFEAEKGLRPAAVLVAVAEREDGSASILLTRRPASLPDHGGQIAFAGGKMEAGESPGQTALREAYEEIGLERKYIKVLGRLETHITGTGFAIAPILAVIRPGFALVPCPREVEEIFELPLEMAMQADNYRPDMVSWQGVSRPSFVIEHGPYYIWGATATILKKMQERLYP